MRKIKAKDVLHMLVDTSEIGTSLQNQYVRIKDCRTIITVGGIIKRIWGVFYYLYVHICFAWVGGCSKCVGGSMGV